MFVGRCKEDSRSGWNGDKIWIGERGMLNF